MLKLIISIFFTFNTFAAIEYVESLEVWQRNELKQILIDAIGEQKMPSVIAAATLDDKVIWARGVGYVDIENKKSPLVQKHLYRWASVSKVATEQFAQGLAEQGRLNLSLPISTYIKIDEPSFYRRCFSDAEFQQYLTCTKNYGGFAPIEMMTGFKNCFYPTSLKPLELTKNGKVYEAYISDTTKASGQIIYRLKDSTLKCSAKYTMQHAYVSSHKVTLMNLLNHTSGVQHYKYLGNEASPPLSSLQNTNAINHRRQNGISQMGWAINYFYPTHPLIFLPGKSYSYSSFGYNLAGYTMEKATGKTFEKIMDEFKWNIGALSMQADYYGLAPVGSYTKVNHYKRSNGKFSKFNYDSDNSYKIAGGGIMSTIVDAAKFCAAIGEPGHLTKNGRKSYSHSGAHTNRTLSRLVLNTGGTGKKQCLVLMTNTNHDGVDLEAIRKKLEQKLYQYKVWFPARARP
jgi:CubicO group peptidase (beta-lactamase class C family)